MQVFWMHRKMYKFCGSAFFPLIHTTKMDFLDTCLNSYFAVTNFGNTSATSAIFFSKLSTFTLYFKNAEKTSQKDF